MDPKRQSMPEAGAYRILRDVLVDLRQAERTLTIVEEAAPDEERALHLSTLRLAIERLVRITPDSVD